MLTFWVALVIIASVVNKFVTNLEVILKKRFLSLALLLFTSYAVSTMTVKAAEPTQQTTVQQTASTTQVTATQTVKVNKNVKAYKLLKIKKKKMKNYTKQPKSCHCFSSRCYKRC